MEVHLRIFFLCFLCFFFLFLFFTFFLDNLFGKLEHILTRASQFLCKMYYFYLLKIYLWLLFILIFLQHLFTLCHSCRLRQIHNYVELFLFKLFASDGSHLRTGGDTPVVGRAHALCYQIFIKLISLRFESCLRVVCFIHSHCFLYPRND